MRTRNRIGHRCAKHLLDAFGKEYNRFCYNTFLSFIFQELKQMRCKSRRTFRNLNPGIGTMSTPNCSFREKYIYSLQNFVLFIIHCWIQHVSQHLCMQILKFDLHSQVKFFIIYLPVWTKLGIDQQFRFSASDRFDIGSPFCRRSLFFVKNKFSVFFVLLS